MMVCEHCFQESPCGCMAPTPTQFGPDNSKNDEIGITATLPAIRRLSRVIWSRIQSIMKRILALGALTALLTGCSTIDSPKIVTPTRVKAVAYLGTWAALKDKPASRPAFVHAAETLRALEGSEKIDFVTLLAIMQGLGVKELQGHNAIVIITAVTLLFDDIGGTLDLSKVDNLRPYVVSMMEGIELALAQK